MAFASVPALLFLPVFPSNGSNDGLKICEVGGWPHYLLLKDNFTQYSYERLSIYIPVETSFSTLGQIIPEPEVIHMENTEF